MVHVNRPYGLTSFMQQSRRGGRSGEISESIVVISSSGYSSGSGSGNNNIASAYSVEHQDKTALEKYLASTTCQQEVLAREFDRDIEETSYIAIDSILYD